MGWLIIALTATLIPFGVAVLMQAFICKTAKTTKTKVIFAAISSAAALCVILMNSFFITIAGAAAYIIGTVTTLIIHIVKERRK